MKAAGARRAKDRLLSTDWLLSPTPPSATGSAVALAGLRLLAGVIWLYNVEWKRPPDFGQRTNTGLFQFTRLAVEHPTSKPFSWLVEHLVLPHFSVYGWTVFLVEAALAVLLLTGTVVRLAALLGIVQSMAIALTVSGSLGAWPWSYAMMIGIHVVLLLAWSTRYAAVDALRAARAGAAACEEARRLLGGWGVVLTLVGVVALVRGAGSHQAANVGTRALQLSLGDYNVAGAVLSIVTGLAMLAAAVIGVRLLAVAAAVLAASVAVSIYLQVGKPYGVWTGGTLTTAVIFVCAAVISMATVHRIGNGPSRLWSRSIAARRP